MRVLFAFASLLFCVAGAPAASAGGTRCEAVSDMYGRASVVCSDDGSSLAEAPGRGEASRPTEPVVVIYSSEVVGGVDCIRTSYQLLSVAFPGYPLTTAENYSASLLSVLQASGLAPCPGVVVPQVTPAEWAAGYVRTIDLPVPAPGIAPGRMLVGLEAYLEAGATLRDSRAEANTPFGPATFELQSVITVDWGDGSERTGPVASSGGAYPDGDLRHVYTSQGRYDVVVTQDWTVTWAVGGEGGTIGGLQTTGTLPGFPVEEREAVIVG